MAGRIRSIKPEILEDEKAAALSDVAWRLWVSTWCLADDHGRFRASAGYLIGQVFWAHGRSQREVDDALAELSTVRLITVYEVNGQRYAVITNWSKHQRVDNAGKPRCPGPEEGTVRGDSPRTAANRGDLPPDPDLRSPISDPEGDPDLGVPRRTAATRQPKKPRAGREAPLPEDWQPTDAHFATAAAQGVSLAQEAELFRNHFRANGKRMLSWNHAFTNWLLRAKQFGHGNGRGPPPVRDRARELWEYADRLEEQERGKS